MEKKDIDPINNKKQFHGYQQWYWNNKLWIRGNYINGLRFGYFESHDVDLSDNICTRFYIL